MAGRNYGNDARTERMSVGASKSRHTNSTAPMRLITGMSVDDEGQNRELLECGHLGSYAVYLNDGQPRVLLGRKRRCNVCGQTIEGQV